jgi:putative pyruvate formate lyase activating enzyme
MPSSGRTPRASYIALERTGELEERARRLDEGLAECSLCPRACRVDRRRELGVCATAAEAVVAFFGPHFSEEPVISGRRGSGTVFLANCNLSCCFCQNHHVSQLPAAFVGRAVSSEGLAAMFIELQDRGCHNINWVSPSHQVPQLVRALSIAARRGLTLPIVYNTNAYDAISTLELLEGIVDVWMPDLKYAEAEVGAGLSGVSDYPQRARAALAEMYRQVGDDFDLAPDGALRRGLLVRVLVLPGDLAGVERSLEWMADHLSPRVAISLLAQYRPAHRAAGTTSFPELARPITGGEWHAAVTALERIMEGNHHHVQGTPA